MSEGAPSLGMQSTLSASNAPGTVVVSAAAATAAAAATTPSSSPARAQLRPSKPSSTRCVSPSLDMLPPELHLQIVGYLSPQTWKTRLSAASKRFRCLASRPEFQDVCRQKLMATFREACNCLHASAGHRKDIDRFRKLTRAAASCGLRPAIAECHV